MSEINPVALILSLLLLGFIFGTLFGIWLEEHFGRADKEGTGK